VGGQPGVQNDNIRHLAVAMAEVQRSEIAELKHRRQTLRFAPVDAKALEDLHAQHGAWSTPLPILRKDLIRRHVLTLPVARHAVVRERAEGAEGEESDARDHNGDAHPPSAT
jgi:hypothetical protein